jgi:hypothetical protein
MHGGERETRRRGHATAPQRPPQGLRIPRNWRNRLPDPETYYRARVAKLSARHSNGWAQGRCPFHDDRNASLSVRLDGERGHWRCFAGCGHGDLMSFHMRLSSLTFVEAVRDLVGGVHDCRT